MKKRKKILIVVLILLILVAIVAGKIYLNNNASELKTVKSEKDLLNLYEEKTEEVKEKLLSVLTMPFSAMREIHFTASSPIYSSSSLGIVPDSLDSVKGDQSVNKNESNDYSKTNIQVENVDEADIIKTDGEYIYSISRNKVIITDARNPNDVKISSKINYYQGQIPEDLILYKNKLVVILASMEKSKKNTIINVYDISRKEKPLLVKECTLYEPYYTSRCIDNKLIVMSSGSLRKEEDKIVTYYDEDKTQKNIEYENIKYLKDMDTKTQTLIATIDLENVEKNIDVNSYLIDISNAYVSENSIYLLEQRYNYGRIPIRTLFGIKGIIGLFDYEYEGREEYTKIIKFDISKDGKIKYNCKTKTIGETINQYSLDEKDGHLRIALYGDLGSKIEIFDENLKKIGESQYVAKGEKMYSSRFIGDKVYFVTYKNMDPLFVMDLSDEKNPKILGELKIPGYNTYLHPYDENHLIGIGMETEEVINRDSMGRVTSIRDKVIGMKMALFDVSDVTNPRQISSTIIGDRRTSSAILKNPKALLFSKEKGIIAIPVNNYSEDFEIKGINKNDSNSTIINSYTKYDKPCISEGYFIYNIDLERGFDIKGVITHEKDERKSYYGYSSKLLRGLYINDNLYTVSEKAVKVNRLSDLEQLSEIKIK